MVALSSLDRLPHTERLAYVHAHRQDLLGRLLIGVLSTGIYCLPSCTAREPKAENVRFFRTEEEAQAAGLRPCRRCRPDYFYRNFDPDLDRLTALVESVRREPAAFDGANALAAVSGIGVTKLHSLFRQHYHTTPAAFLSRVRLAAACALFADSADPNQQVIDVAYAVGYESLSAFHANFRTATGLSPRDYQRLDSADCFSMTLPGNYLACVPLRLLGRDPESPIEQVDGNRAVKALSLGSQAVLLRLEWQGRRVQCRLESTGPLDPASARLAHTALTRMLGFATNPAGFERFVMGKANLARLIEGRHGLRIPLSADLFEGITWAIIGQQVNLAFAYKLRRSLAELCGQPAGHRFVAHPTPDSVARLDYADLTRRQFSRRKAEYLIDLARVIVSGKLVIDPFSAATKVEKQLLNVRGLGPWSVHYVMMRALGFGDCVPLGDTGLSTALQRFFALDHRPDSPETARLMEPFAPYRSLAAYHLWMSLGDNPV